MHRNPEHVIIDYLNELLNEPGPQPAEAQKPVHALPTTLADQQTQLELLKRQQLQTLLDGALAQPEVVAPPEQSVASPVVAPVAAASQAPAELMAWCDNGRPAWAQGHFEILSFQVGGLTLAVPLVALGQIYRVSEGLTPIFGQAKWFMGIQPTQAGNLRVVDTALFVMPERYAPELRAAAKFIISIDGSHWALAVEQVGQPRKIDPASVNWRAVRSKRLWLAGTIAEQMCALIDVPQMARLLAAAEKQQIERR